MTRITLGGDTLYGMKTTSAFSEAVRVRPRRDAHPEAPPFEQGTSWLRGA